MHPETFLTNSRTWVAVAFVLFFVLFGKMLWKALASMLDSRSAAVRSELEEAARLRREAEAMLKDAEKRRADALSEAQIAAARDQAMRALRQVATDTATTVITRLTGAAPDPAQLDGAIGTALAARQAA